MLRTFSASVVILVALTASAQAQVNEGETATAPESVPSLSTMTPEMWLYLHEQRREDSPQLAIRRRAELKAAQRRARIASSKWYGMSKSRPTATVTPFTESTYSPMWVGNTMDPLQWQGAGVPYGVPYNAFHYYDYYAPARR